MYKGSLKYFYCKKYNHESIGVLCPNYNVENKIRQYISKILFWNTQSDVMKEKLDYWLYFF